MAILSVNKLLKAELESLDKQLKTRSRTKVEMINTMSDHIISSGGKRLRPITLLLSAYSVNNRLENTIIDSSVVVEFIHAATLLHDDVVDMSHIRHNIDTAHTIWGNKGAVLVGDFLYSRAFEIIVEINSPLVYETLAQTTNIIAQGEVMQLTNIGNIDISENLYMDIIFRKTSILFQASMKIGAILNKGTDEEIQSLAKFGLHFGNAYQMRNDYLDYFGNSESTGKNIIEDLIEGKTTLPIIHAMQNASEADQKIIKSSFKQADHSVADIIINILRKYKADIFMDNKIEEQTQNAIDSLDQIRSSEYKDKLVELASYCMTRTN
ncbi:MAG: polyprenyl synthetase family protein [Gammaproteobacteria bacterium]|nr:polyprenyl synthetase family protein [Gammaproteobacteria bacterium]|tara:strand:+ start:2807 stop:3778 length:972 start_codon:yes stop_codon:yes gene_type:complete